MARMIPPQCAADTPRGERQLFTRLRDDRATAEWIVLHSFDIRRHVARSEGEADVVIIVPQRGVLCIEVKGCDVTRRDGMWVYSYSPPKSSPVGPFRQASEAAHSIRNHIHRSDSALGALLYCSAVIFTEIDFSETSLEWERWQSIGCTDFIRRPISSLIDRVFDEAHARCRNGQPAPRWYSDRSSRPSKAQAEQLLRLLRGDFEYIGSIRSRSLLAEDQIRRFTEEQFDALDQIADNPRILFQGPAGTGKTVLALETARRAIASGQSVLMVCFNTLLADWLLLQTELLRAEAAAANIRFEVGTLAAVMRRISGCAVPPGATSTFWDEELPNSTVDALLSLDDAPTFDVLVVDEAQDLSRDLFLDVMALLLEGGLNAGRWAMFGDFERQSIYDVEGGAAATARLRERAGDALSFFRLRINCRNSAPIAEAVTITSGLSPGYSRTLMGSDAPEVEPRFYRTASHQLQQLHDVIALSLQSFTGEDIVVLSTRADSDAAASQALRNAMPLSLAPYRAAAAVGSVRFASVHAFKGLEASVVILTDIDRIDTPQAQALLYVGMSRARTQLYLLMNERLRSSYDSLLNQGLRAALGRKVDVRA